MIQLTIAPKEVLVVSRAFHGIARLIAALREAGCRVELATTSSEAIARAAVLNPEVVVIEDQLSDVNSVELSMQIRSIVSRDSPPTFIMAMPCELDAKHTQCSANHRNGNADQHNGGLCAINTSGVNQLVDQDTDTPEQKHVGKDKHHPKGQRERVLQLRERIVVD